MIGLNNHQVEPNFIFRSTYEKRIHIFVVYSTARSLFVEDQRRVVGIPNPVTTFAVMIDV